jgi:hypothetical protein
MPQPSPLTRIDSQKGIQVTSNSVTRDPWADIAAELHRIADDAADLIGQPAPAQFAIHIQPKPRNKAEAVAAVDTIAMVLLGKPGVTKEMNSGGIYHRDASGSRGLISLAVYRQVPSPEAAELAVLRAELAELRTKQICSPAPHAHEQCDASGFGYSRDDATGLVSGGLVANCPTCGSGHCNEGHW